MRKRETIRRALEQALTTYGNTPVDPCAKTAEALAGIWDDDVKNAIEGAFVATEHPSARDSFERASKVIDAYAE